MSDEWYYAQNDERKGPVTFNRLKAMTKNGWLAPNDLVWRAGMGAWQPAKQTAGLFNTPLSWMLPQAIAGLRKTEA